MPRSAPAAPREIRTGADDESEMGAFHLLHAPQREANLRIRLEEYLRFSLEAGRVPRDLMGGADDGRGL